MASLLALSRAEADEAKRLWLASIVAHGSTLLLGAGALFAGEPATYVLAVLALVAEIVAWWSQHEASERHVLAEEGRRRASLIENLGSDPESLDRVGITSRYSRRACSKAVERQDSHYWQTELSPGPERLREALTESAFWSCALYRVAARRWALVVIALVLLLALAVFALSSISLDGASAVTSRVGVVFLTVLITSDALSTALAWRSASAMSDRVLRRLDAADASDLGTMAAIFADYATATASCPPIPNGIYNAEHDRLDQAWASRAKRQAE
jgi:hypothetical protein